MLWSVLEPSLLMVDEALSGRRARVVLALALFQALLAPALDKSLASLRDVASLSSIAQSAGKVDFAGFSFFSLLGAVLLISTVSVVSLGRMAAFRVGTRDAGGSRFGALADAWLVTRTEFVLLLKRPWAERFLFVGLAGFVATTAIRDASRLVRWAAWEGPLDWFGLQETVLSAPFVMLYGFENLLEMVALFSAVCSLLGMSLWLMQPVRPSVAASAGCHYPRGLATLDPLFHPTEEAGPTRIGKLFEGDKVAATLRALRDWSPPADAVDEKTCQHSLYTHFRNYNFDVEMEYRPGQRRRIDLVLDGAVAVELKFGSLGATERDRVHGQSAVYAALWIGRGPVIVVGVSTPTERLRALADHAQRWNAGLSNHTAWKEMPAPILVVAHNRAEA